MSAEDEDDYARAAPAKPASKPVVPAAPQPAKQPPASKLMKAPATLPTDISSIVAAFEKEKSDMPSLPPIERILRACGMPAEDLRESAEMIVNLIATMQDTPRAEQKKMVETVMGRHAHTLANAAEAINKIALEINQQKRRK